MHGGLITLQENYWNTKNIDDDFKTMEELKEILRNKKWKMPGKNNLNSELYKYAGDSFQERRLFF